mmetsp:Transcript_87043/g.193642  ORF Transcript_87043/g.193642 Transcript_87043/m.193642 type:complete len:94 (+) Transcript_87043:40-321(+)
MCLRMRTLLLALYRRSGDASAGREAPTYQQFLGRDRDGNAVLSGRWAAELLLSGCGDECFLAISLAQGDAVCRPSLTAELRSMWKAACSPQRL